MANINIQEQREKFIETANTYIHREGLDALLNYLSKADFFTAPASSRFHGAYPGGLCEHAMDVLAYALRVKELYDGEIDPEELAVAALFHDVCKVNFYKQDKRNQKIDGVWQEVPFYSVDEKFNFGGHGAKSVFLVERFMRLHEEEAIAINCHMGFADVKDTYPISNAYEKHPLAWIIHVADEASTFLLKRI